jgi:hypothetical protein
LAFRRLLDVVIPPIQRPCCIKGNRHPNFSSAAVLNLMSIKHPRPETALNIAFIKRSSAEIVSSGPKVSAAEEFRAIAIFWALPYVSIRRR